MSFSPDAMGQLNVLRHDGDPLCINSTQVSITEQSHEIILSSGLDGVGCFCSKVKICLEVLSDFPDQTKKWQLSQQEGSGLLIELYVGKEWVPSFHLNSLCFLETL